MSIKIASWRVALGSVATLGLMSACAVTGVGYDGPVGYVGGFYEPYGYDYGGWGGRYRVGPPRGGYRPGGGRGPGAGGGGRGAPSIPGRSRGR